MALANDIRMERKAIKKYGIVILGQLNGWLFCLERMIFVVYEIYCDVNGSSYVYWSSIN